MKTKRIVFLAVFTALGLMLSYVEFLLPIPLPIPGIKLGLANVLTVFLLYRFSWKEAFSVSLLRVILSSVLFNISALPYSLVGMLMSLAVEILLKKTNCFSAKGVSIAGGVAHNAAQILLACLIMSTAGIVSYLPVLILTGTVSGLVIGLLGEILIQKIKTP